MSLDRVGITSKSSLPKTPMTSPPTGLEKRSGTTLMPGNWLTECLRGVPLESAEWMDFQKERIPLVEVTGEEEVLCNVPLFPSSRTETVVAALRTLRLAERSIPRLNRVMLANAEACFLNQTKRTEVRVVKESLLALSICRSLIDFPAKISCGERLCAGFLIIYPTAMNILWM